MKAFGITERSYFHVYGVTIPLKPGTCEQPVSYPSFFLPLGRTPRGEAGRRGTAPYPRGGPAR